MSTPAPRFHNDEKEIYQFACPNCWAVRTITLMPGIDRPMCDCGSPLFVLGEVKSEEAEYLPLDHPHTDSNCSFCAVRQTSMQHKALVCDSLPEELQLRVRSTALIVGRSLAHDGRWIGRRESSQRECAPRSEPRE